MHLNALWIYFELRGDGRNAGLYKISVGKALHWGYITLKFSFLFKEF